MVFRALENRNAITAAVRTWARKFSLDAERFSFRGLDAYSHPVGGIWGAFNDPTGSRGLLNYWNPFGRTPHSSIVVEINPPRSGINTNVQGVVATNSKGQRWILHQGRLHPSKIRISEDMFDNVITRDRVSVTFSDGQKVNYHTVANIDAEAAELRSQIASFVDECERVRQYYLGAPHVRNNSIKLSPIEGLFPEPRGGYEVGSQEAKWIVKKHPDVWRKLNGELTEKSVPCSNGRVGRWGPDLLTLGKKPILFEIKSGESASELQRAVGQLLLYEKLLKALYLKVLVYPQSEKSTNGVRSALEKLNIRVLSYSQYGRSIRFDPILLAELIRYAKDIE